MDRAVAIAHALGTLLLVVALLAGASHASRTPAPPPSSPPQVPASAFGESGFHGDEPRVEARLLVDPGTAEQPTIRAGVLFDLDPGWHLYWRNPGDTGLPTETRWTLRGAELAELQWPAPEAFSESDGLFVTYGYEGRVLLYSELALSEEATQERVIAVDVDLLICEHECIPASFSLERSLTAALVDSPENAGVHALFDAQAARVPRPANELGLELEALYSKSALRPGDAFQSAIAVRSCAAGPPCIDYRPSAGEGAFFPEADLPVAMKAGALRSRPGDDETRLLTFDGQVLEPVDVDGSPRLRGLLALESPDGGRAHARIDLPLPIASADLADDAVTELGAHWLAPSAPGGGGSPLGMLEAVLLALVGGLILNLMPCVLPVLAIKVFAIAELAGRDRRHVIANGAAYAAGILSSMAVLACAVLVLRAVGSQVGWGFQFQSPLFISCIAILLVAFALNLFGVFEISVDVGGAAQLGQQSTGTRRSFFEGLLAVILATPCSAPFLGTAVGFAFAGSPLTILAIFLAVGVGLAAPFVLVTLVPGWARFVPKSGAWMLKLRAGLGFALLATVIWLLSIAGGQSGVMGMISLISLLLTVAFGLWIFGMLQTSGRDRLKLAAGMATVLLAIVGLDLVHTQLSKDVPLDSGLDAQARALGWEKWDPASIRTALDDGQPVLVVFSAEWCITCKVNERVVLQDQRVTSELERLDVRVFKADWTRRDDTIRAELARHGRAGVPMYLIYDPRSPDQPAQLPELLSVGVMVESLRAAAQPALEGVAS
jgi:thiol:disulfide interchange protein DsbD